MKLRLRKRWNKLTTPIRRYLVRRSAARFRRQNEAYVEKAVVRLFQSRGLDDYAVQALTEHVLGRKIYNTDLVERIALRTIYGEKLTDDEIL